MSRDHRTRKRLLEEARAHRDKGDRSGASSAMARKGRWKDTYEVAMGAYCTESMKRIEGGFSVGVDLPSGWRSRVELATFDEAWEALRVLQQFGIALVYALTWAKEPSPSELKADPDRGAVEAYLKHLAKATADNKPTLGELARGDWHADGPRTRSVVELPRPKDWDFGPEIPATFEHLYVVTVRSDSLVLESDCTTLARARQYLGVFDALATDLVEIQGWKPLPETQANSGRVNASARRRLSPALLAVGALTLAAIARRGRRGS